MDTQRKQSALIWILLALCVLAIPVGLMGKSVQKADRDDDDKPDFQPGSSFMMKYKDRIQVIRLGGMIVEKAEASLLSPSDSSVSVLKNLRKAAKDDKIKAVLLRINSPGGTVATSQEISSAIANLKKAGKPVYSSMADLAASGGYYVAVATDRIYAQPGTMTGSIGVIMSTVNLKGLADKLGVQPQVVKSGTFKDIASPYRPMTPDEQKILKDLIMDSYEEFTQAIAAGRKMKLADVKRLGDGRVYSGKQAKSLGLIDELGSYEDALDALQKVCMDKYKLRDKLPVDDKSSDSILSNLLDSSVRLPAPGASLHMIDGVLPLHLRPEFYNQPMWIMQ